MGNLIGAGEKTIPASPAHTKAGCTACLFFVLTQLTACGYADYSTKRENFISQQNLGDSRTLGNIYLNLNQSDTAVPYAMEVSRISIKNKGPMGSTRGYGFSAPVYDNKDDFRTHFTLAKTNDYKWFSGMQFRWEF